MSDTTKQALSEVEETLEFRWVKKRGIGGVRKEVQFYESFVYDGVQYNLYDCVYLYKDGEPEPYVAKLIKIWEHPGNLKRVKVLWFFRPSEIVNHIGNEQEAVLQNELFLATGDGLGLTNINPLEAIAGKCNVICTSKDAKNPQPSEEEMKTADYVFYRTFNVNTFKISDKIDEKIATVQDTFIYNRTADGKDTNGISKPDCGKAEVNFASKHMPGDTVGCEKGDDSVRLDKPGGPLRVGNERLVAPEVIHDSLPSEAVVSDEAASNIVSKQGNVSCGTEAQAMSLKRSQPDGKIEDDISKTSCLDENGNSKPVNGGSREADMTPSKKPRVKSLRKKRN
ncbi:protein ANTI-SILENCING 1-like [Papaver somniferum]|uniref:protein ANTI-SILENCING 1-like n=1 Tax=Papaver somniferum TaxID=3469 RepID=UPI000E7024D6|nr:protein ANTI-SILENCING 1-like [Papaver somniferum]